MKKIVSTFAIAVIPFLLLSGCGGSDSESDEQADLQSTYMSDFEWAVGQMEDVYDDYGVETGAWRLLEVREIYATSANEMNGLDYAVQMIIEFAIKPPRAEKWFEGGVPSKWVEGEYSEKVPYCGSRSSEYEPAEPIFVQVTSWNGDRQLPCLSKFRNAMGKYFETNPSRAQ